MNVDNYDQQVTNTLGKMMRTTNSMALDFLRDCNFRFDGYYMHFILQEGIIVLTRALFCINKFSLYKYTH